MKSVLLLLAVSMFLISCQTATSKDKSDEVSDVVYRSLDVEASGSLYKVEILAKADKKYAYRILLKKQNTFKKVFQAKFQNIDVLNSVCGALDTTCEIQDFAVMKGKPYFVVFKSMNKEKVVKLKNGKLTEASYGPHTKEVTCSLLKFPDSFKPSCKLRRRK